jgi:hypothetical protein
MSYNEVNAMLGECDLRGVPLTEDSAQVVFLRNHGWNGDLGDLKTEWWFSHCRVSSTKIALTFDEKNKLVYIYRYPDPRNP